MKSYLRKLTPTEVKRHYIYVTTDHRDILPKMGEPFKIWINEEKMEAKLDAQGRIWLDWRAFEDLKSGDTVELIRNPDGTFSLEAVGNEEEKEGN
ncbi:hypothetical protein DRO69_06535 [Candidatus Bathyarchaeota archaeon]|nr:MAG: hypothetical protein DRO69_06535 [Candidatus Bathyarchaeota archaeon]